MKKYKQSYPTKWREKFKVLGQNKGIRITFKLLNVFLYEPKKPNRRITDRQKATHASYDIISILNLLDLKIRTINIAD